MLWNTVYMLLVFLFENNDVIGAPNIILPWAPQILLVALFMYNIPIPYNKTIIAK